MLGRIGSDDQADGIVVALGDVASAFGAQGDDAGAHLQQLASELFSNVWEASSEEARCGAALAISGISRGLGPAFLEKTEIVSRLLLQGIGGDKTAQLAMISAINMLMSSAANVFEPFLFHHAIMPEVCIQMYVKGSVEVRKAALACTLRITGKLSMHGIERVMPPLLRIANGECTGHMGHWRAKVLSMRILSKLGSANSLAFFNKMPQIVTAVMECLTTTKKDVCVAAKGALETMMQNIKNPEIAGLVPEISKAMIDPSMTFPCIEELMDTTFINSIDRACLAIIVPIVLRGFRDGKGEMKKNAATITKNICSLVASVDDIVPFVPDLLPEVEKAIGHSNPEVRRIASAAKEQLLADVGDLVDGNGENARASIVSPRASADGNRRVDLVLKKSLGDDNAALGKVGMQYVRDIAQYALAGVIATSKRLRAANVDDLLRPELAFFLRDTGITADTDFEILLRDLIAVFLQLRRASRRDLSHRRSSSKVSNQVLMRMDNIILAFTSKVLLTRTSLEMRIGKRYAFLGNNGVGKTTLMDRLAQKDIAGFPQNISVYYIRHEILEESSISVRDWMKQDMPSGKSDSDVEDALDNFSFSEELRAGAVKALSGGWRMKLGIARSMLFEFDLLLADEPTNHLDVKSVEFLANYLKSLVTSTVCIVSHDYDFVETVATDIVHIANQRLTQYSYGFRDFQRLILMWLLPCPKCSTLAMEKVATVLGQTRRALVTSHRRSRCSRSTNRMKKSCSFRIRANCRESRAGERLCWRRKMSRSTTRERIGFCSRTRRSRST